VELLVSYLGTFVFIGIGLMLLAGILLFVFCRRWEFLVCAGVCTLVPRSPSCPGQEARSSFKHRLG
jgi:hypothetical protein